MIVTLPVTASVGTVIRRFLESNRFDPDSTISVVAPDPLLVKATFVASASHSPWSTTAVPAGPAEGWNPVKSGGCKTSKVWEEKVFPVAVLTPIVPLEAPVGTVKTRLSPPVEMVAVSGVPFRLTCAP